MIKAKQYYYETGGCHGMYLTRIVYINKDDISTVKEHYCREYDCKSKISMKTGETLDCKESVDEIIKAMESEDI